MQSSRTSEASLCELINRMRTQKFDLSPQNDAAFDCRPSQGIQIVSRDSSGIRNIALLNGSKTTKVSADYWSQPAELLPEENSSHVKKLVKYSNQDRKSERNKRTSFRSGGKQSHRCEYCNGDLLPYIFSHPECTFKPKINERLPNFERAKRKWDLELQRVRKRIPVTKPNISNMRMFSEKKDLKSQSRASISIEVLGQKSETALPGRKCLNTGPKLTKENRAFPPNIIPVKGRKPGWSKSILKSSSICQRSNSTDCECGNNESYLPSAGLRKRIRREKALSRIAEIVGSSLLSSISS